MCDFKIQSKRQIEEYQIQDNKTQENVTVTIDKEILRQHDCTCAEFRNNLITTSILSKVVCRHIIFTIFDQTKN